MAKLSGEKTLAELSAEFGVHPTMISNWKQELVKRAGELFGRGSKAPAAEDAQKVIDDLHRKIGQLQVECDFLAGQPAISRARYDRGLSDRTVETLHRMPAPRAGSDRLFVVRRRGQPWQRQASTGRKIRTVAARYLAPRQSAHQRGIQEGCSGRTVSI